MATAMLAGRIAVVTGASRGIGRAIAQAFAEAGADLAICARDGGAIDRAAAELQEGRTTRVLGLRCDLGRSEALASFATEVETTLGTPDVIVHNAAIVERLRLDELSEAQWDAILDVNLKAPAMLTRAFLPRMRARRSGRILFIGSISGTLGTPRLSAYCASKHAIIGLARSLAEELREDGIQVNVINPGSVNTDMLRGSGFAPDLEAGDVAGLVLYLATIAPAALTGTAVDLFG
jgi:NAD(P)-dependent dehydrogenase (short-subunit alcohol dehydrogenase family)